MRKYGFGLWLAAVTVASGAACQSALAQKFEVVTGKAFDSAVPKDFYLEGNAIPTEPRNAVLVKTPAGARALFALIDTTGYSANIVTKWGATASVGRSPERAWTRRASSRSTTRPARP
jgi:hypothetical protein